MKIAYIHFHLKTGGVTSVIAQQAQVMRAEGSQCIALCGQVPEASFPAEVCEIPGLAYDQDAINPKDAASTADAILAAILKKWPQGPDLIHVHNPTLAKNKNLQAVLKRLQKHGLRILCQIHDFAEDGRPQAYFKEPYLSDCHYAVLNRRDLGILRRAGLTREGVHLLPNAIAPFTGSLPQPPLPTAPILYPVRAIRRKNVGEAILLSLYFKGHRPLAITLPPNSPQDIQAHDFWKAAVASLGLAVRFEAGLTSHFEVLLAGCHHVLTTSVAEGFGFAFVQPWLAGKALWGRWLPGICDDLTARGIRLSHLYTRLRVPLKWIEADRVKQIWISARRAAAGLFGLSPTEAGIETSWQSICSDDCIDFGILNERLQQQVIAIVSRDRDAFLELEGLNPWLDSPEPIADNKALIEHNRSIIAREYNPQQNADLLKRIYRQVIDTPVVQKIDKALLSTEFLNPECFSLLKWSSYHA